MHIHFHDKRKLSVVRVVNLGNRTITEKPSAHKLRASLSQMQTKSVRKECSRCNKEK